MKATILLAAFLFSCSFSGSGKNDPPVDPSADGTLTTFVVDMVQNQTIDDQPAVEADSFTILPDPDGDENNVAAYDMMF